MAMYKCKNFGSCSRADSGEEFSLATGTDDKCPECGSTLVRSEGGDVSSDAGQGAKRKSPVLIATVGGAVLLILLGVGYMKWNNSQVVVLKPDTSLPPVVASASTTADSPAAPVASAASEVALSSKPAPMVAN